MTTQSEGNATGATQIHKCARLPNATLVIYQHLYLSIEQVLSSEDL